ncbi:MAG: B12-binding domain-containing radical SAM protein [Sedimentisphaerales bacterium]|nr:B12-binding domain-containing radical SAM protein [Sedimentisphaerales bacterium]
MAQVRLRHSTDGESGSHSSMHGHGIPEPIGLEYIGSSLVSAGYSCHFRGNNELTISSASESARLCLFSALSCEYPGVIDAAQRAKARGETTVLGGYQASGYQDDLADGPFDYVVIGEGEEVAPAIAKAVIRGDTSDLYGFESRTVGSVHIIRALRITDLDALPEPLREQERLAQYRIYDLMWPPASQQQNTALILGSRGCANDCDFCASSTVWGRGIRPRSTDRVVKELQALKSDFGTNTVVFIDQSLGQAKRWTLGLCDAIKSAGLAIHWYHQSNLTIHRDVIRAMAEAGCSKIGFGLEGISPRAISIIKPANPCDIDSINSLFDYCNSLGLFVKVYLMIGFPWETEEIVREYFEWLPRIRTNQIKISYLTPFPGTSTWARFKNQLITSNWDDFDTVRMPVVHNPNISAKRYHEIRAALFRSFYGSDTYADLTQQMLAVYPDYIKCYREFADYLRQFNMVSDDAPWLEWVRYSQVSKVSAAVQR